MKNCFSQKIQQPSNATEEFHKKDTKLNIKHTSWHASVAFMFKNGKNFNSVDTFTSSQT